MPSSPSCLLTGPSLLWAEEELITGMLVTCGPSPSRPKSSVAGRARLQLVSLSPCTQCGTCSPEAHSPCGRDWIENCLDKRRCSVGLCRHLGARAHVSKPLIELDKQGERRIRMQIRSVVGRRCLPPLLALGGEPRHREQKGLLEITQLVMCGVDSHRGLRLQSLQLATLSPSPADVAPRASSLLLHESWGPPEGITAPWGWLPPQRTLIRPLGPGKSCSAWIPCGCLLAPGIPAGLPNTTVGTS